MFLNFFKVSTLGAASAYPPWRENRYNTYYHTIHYIRTKRAVAHNDSDLVSSFFANAKPLLLSMLLDTILSTTTKSTTKKA
eukprot:scaffold2614_cov132-Amphora_coffeaeformis.AAC.4